MRILAVDPGFDRLGVAVVEGTLSKPILIFSDCITPPKGEKHERLAHILQEIDTLIVSHSPEVFALETLFFTNNARTAIGVAQARGVLLALAGKHKLAVVELSPQQIKVAVTGSGSAKKEAVAKMIPYLVQLPEKKRLDDEFDAIACGICALGHYKK
jgi:crossover junction endodeoxyribonuclease RuvC